MSAPSSPSRPARFDHLARVYAPLEWLTFGGALARRRRCFLGDASLAGARRVLVLGDGDGRFTAEMLVRRPDVQVTAVDASRGMLTALQARVRRRTPGASLRVHRADILAWTPPDGARYDVVTAHFFFDCFSTDDVRSIVARIAPSLAADARWLVSDFAVPAGRIRGALARALIRSVYLGFAVLAGLRVTRLPDHAAALRDAGFTLRDRRAGLGGVLRSELWERAPARARGRSAQAATAPAP